MVDVGRWWEIYVWFCYIYDVFDEMRTCSYCISLNSRDWCLIMNWSNRIMILVYDCELRYWYLNSYNRKDSNYYREVVMIVPIFRILLAGRDDLNILTSEQCHRFVLWKGDENIGLIWSEWNYYDRKYCGKVFERKSKSRMNFMYISIMYKILKKFRWNADRKNWHEKKNDLKRTFD